MAKYNLFPSKYVRDMSKKEGKTPREFMYGKTISYRSVNYDKRRMDKYGSMFYDDLLITRSDGSRFLLHEAYSKIEKYKLLEINEVNQMNEVEPTVIVYADADFDVGKLQNDSLYLDAVADELLSKKRIETKKIQQDEESIGYIYVGNVREITPGSFRKEAYEFEGVKDEINSVLQELNEKEIQGKMRQKMLDAIKGNLDSLSNEELQQICKTMGISIDNSR